eukprot:scaffold50987_cov75-Cyclotella_meneghiniana.AAC.1
MVQTGMAPSHGRATKHLQKHLRAHRTYRDPTHLLILPVAAHVCSHGLSKSSRASSEPTQTTPTTTPPQTKAPVQVSLV